MLCPVLWVILVDIVAYIYTVSGTFLEGLISRYWAGFWKFNLWNNYIVTSKINNFIQMDPTFRKLNLQMFLYNYTQYMQLEFNYVYFSLKSETLRNLQHKYF